MRNILAVALGAAIGANLRYFVSLWAAQRFGSVFPYGTLIVNVAGCLVIGFLLAIIETRLALSTYWRLLLVTGLLGSLTTFSTFSYETYERLVSGAWLVAVLNMAVSLGLGLVAVMLGVALARLL